ncbi:MAG: hypothetical protein OXF06_02920 [Bacteroidetes bacterium]|nr:hypothetical protein [Bacteroidota bacterium]
MAQKGSGKAFRIGMSIVDIIRMFPDNETAERWFAHLRWGGNITCPQCGCGNI